MRIESSNCSLTYFIKSFRTLNGNFYGSISNLGEENKNDNFGKC